MILLIDFWKNLFAKIITKINISNTFPDMLAKFIYISLTNN